MGVGSCPLLPLTVREGDGDYVTRAPPPACCTHPAVQTHAHIKRTLTLADVTDKDVFQLDKNTDEKHRTVQKRLPAISRGR
ncbi:uncharacterized [Lates japonicus]